METEQAYVPAPELKAATERILRVNSPSQRRGEEWLRSPDRRRLEAIFAAGVLVLPPVWGTIIIASIASYVSTGDYHFFKLDCTPPGVTWPVRVWKIRSKEPIDPSLNPKTTKVGHVLRRTSVDELPQLLNILRGELSLVGPRPWTIDEWLRIIIPNSNVYPYEQFYERVRRGAPFGMLGLYGLFGRKMLSTADRCWLGLGYYDYASLQVDVDILVRTVPAVVSMKGAY